MKHPNGADWLKLGTTPKPHAGPGPTALIPAAVASSHMSHAPETHQCLVRLEKSCQPFGAHPSLVLPHSRVGRTITPPQIRPCSSASTSVAALHQLRHGATSTVAEPTPGYRQWHCGGAPRATGTGGSPGQRGQIRLGHPWVCHVPGARDSRGWVFLALGCPSKCFCAPQGRSSRSPRAPVPSAGRGADPGTLSLH